jgi:RND family efflux transporter MFP subunit
VSVRSPQVRPYAPTKEFTGRLVTKDPVKVVPRVSGIVVRKAFLDGDAVVKDKTVLFEIDKSLYEADLNKAKADVAKAEADAKNWTAQIKLAEVDLARVTTGFQKGGIAQTDVDRAQATLDVNKAQLDVAKAAKEAAVAARDKAADNLGYCTILAPTTGRTRQAQVAERSLVDAYKTELVVVDPVDEIYAIWDVDELTSLWYRDQIFQKKEIPNPRDKDTPLRCHITLRDGRTYPAPGRPGVPIDFYDPEIVRSTGTRTVRATFPNPDAALSSGDSVLVRVDAGRPRQVLTVPEAAVFAQQGKRYVYVLGPDDAAQLREVEPGPPFDGVVIIEKGLTTADRVVVDNLLRVRPGAKVQAQK